MEEIFNCTPFKYAHSNEKQITDILFEGTALRISIKPLKNDSNVDQFVNFAYQNKWEVNLYVEHSGYDALDIRDQGKTIVDDEGNESIDAYCSSVEEDLSYVNFHTEVDANVVIKTVTTNDPFLNKLCFDSGQFINLIDEHVNANVETVIEDTENIDPEFTIKQGVSYLRYDPKQDWNKMEPVLGMRFKHPEQLKLCLANYEVANGYQLCIKKRKKKELSDDESLNVKKVTTKSRSNTDEGTSKSPKTPMKAITSGEGCLESPKLTKAKVKGRNFLSMSVLDSVRELSKGNYLIMKEDCENTMRGFQFQLVSCDKFIRGEIWVDGGW
ncbi:hypothetical protein Tco_1348779, partial [Tanacetum coccineum]